MAENSSSTVDGEDPLEEREVPCTLCSIDLWDPSYEVMEHPKLPVPLCLLCYDGTRERIEEETAEIEEEGESDRCSWCLEFSDQSLFICEDGLNCKFQFCVACLQNNLGEEFVDKVREQDEWTCLHCDPTPLGAIRDGLAAALDNSDFRHLPSPEDRLTCLSGNREEDLRIAGVYLGLIEHMVKQGDEARKCCEPAALEEKLKEIKEELKTTVAKEDLDREASNELDLFRKQWEARFDLLQHQEAYLVDIFETLVRKAKIDDLPEEKIDSDDEQYQSRRALQCYDYNEDDPDQAARREADLEIRRRNKQDEIHLPGPTQHLEDWIGEESDEEDSTIDEALKARIAAMRDEIEQHEIVRKYASCEDPLPGSYPSIFNEIYPKSLLKALYHSM